MLKEKVFCTQLKGRQRFLRLLGDSTKAVGLRCGLVTLKPKELIGEHKTENKEEVIIILKGNATVHFGKNKKLKAPQNSFVFIPSETLHNVENSGSVILQYVYVTTQVA
ncbi:MAG: cupin domain-containing protein [Candidatus Omnitrophica bacterium]|jgi:mannose-6-phosphate isomerase-like protein (cupin superfamily)|nr:cupin domain-containing protein [Candidatus Omnitrophota bacterium]